MKLNFFTKICESNLVNITICILEYVTLPLFFLNLELDYEEPMYCVTQVKVTTYVKTRYQR